MVLNGRYGIVLFIKLIAANKASLRSFIISMHKLVYTKITRTLINISCLTTFTCK